MKKVLRTVLALSMILGLLSSMSLAVAAEPNEGDTPAQSSLHTDYFTIYDPGGGAQPPMTYTDSQIHVTDWGTMSVCLQDVGVAAYDPPSWADDIANVYVDGVVVGTYDSYNNPEPAPGPGPVQCFTTIVGAGTHTVVVEVIFSVIPGSMFAKEIEVTVTDIDIDIKPGSYPNSINLGSRGVVPVAVLTTADFDASTVDPATVMFAGAAPLRWAMEDVDYDGDMDLIFHFRTRELNLDEFSTEAILTGVTFGGQAIQGVDTVNIVP